MDTKKQPEECECKMPGNDITSKCGKGRLTEEIITDWRQKKKTGKEEGKRRKEEKAQIREDDEEEWDRRGREKREDADKHLKFLDSRNSSRD